MFEICREMLKEKEHAKWASHVSYSNDVLLVDEKTHRPVEYSNGRAVGELPSGFTRPA
eukprot:CAMPEP_0180154562 /NCGR_PEP_ID=MMETSP0986-20121125/24248_1 /TAXON_ID=697907 /ORGANISM="non described non described, Strain CCMP2293" /LENGTH=57 /DNA_ID=CAMNT_0022102971 /DNA_START=92 /DNA_END=265 /DNA_ORIENTATION=+